MNLNFEFSPDTLLISKEDLKEILSGIISEIHAECNGEEVMTIKETAEYLKVSVPTVRSMIINKEIPYFQRGQVIRLSKPQIVQWMNHNDYKW